jgi:hypothetical protein
MSEINPNHPMTRAVHDHWHKFVAILLHKFGKKEITISLQDVMAMREEFNDDVIVIAQEKGENIVLRLVTGEEGRRLARAEGGLPI